MTIGHAVIMIVMAAVMIIEPVSGGVDHGFEYDADVVDHDLDVFEPVSGGEDLLQHSVPLLADTPHLDVDILS